jgi:hypothetical protein
MTSQIEMTYEHVLNLQPGSEGRIEFHFPVGERKTFQVRLAALDQAGGAADLVIDNMWGEYEIRQYLKDTGRWKAISPDRNGELHALVSFGPGKHLSISSDFATIHSLDLVDVARTGNALRLTFREVGQVRGS